MREYQVSRSVYLRGVNQIRFPYTHSSQKNRCPRHRLIAHSHVPYLRRCLEHPWPLPGGNGKCHICFRHSSIVLSSCQSWMPPVFLYNPIISCIIPKFLYGCSTIQSCPHGDPIPLHLLSGFSAVLAHQSSVFFLIISSRRGIACRTGIP